MNITIENLKIEASDLDYNMEFDVNINQRIYSVLAVVNKPNNRLPICKFLYIDNVMIMGASQLLWDTFKLPCSYSLIHELPYVLLVENGYLPDTGKEDFETELEIARLHG